MGCDVTKGLNTDITPISVTMPRPLPLVLIAPCQTTLQPPHQPLSGYLIMYSCSPGV